MHLRPPPATPRRSTGRPKGVVVAHASVVSLAHNHARILFGLARRRTGARALRVGHAWPFSFDASWQPLLALLCGHELHLAGDDTRRDPQLLATLIAGPQIDVIELSPGMLRQILATARDAGTPLPLRVLGTGGDAVDATLWRELRELDGTVGMNFYGPTESTVDAIVARADDSERPTIGWPVDNTTAYVLDAGLSPVAVGVAGELYLGGTQLARGYLGDPAATAERFVPDPFGLAGARMYRTGDLARRRDDGALEFVGRADDQLKIRGFRIEPAEVESVLLSHPSVRAAVVVGRRHGGDLRLVASVVGAGADADAGGGGGGADAATLRRHAAQRLPDYMVPAAITVLDALPLTARGKLDRRALPNPDFAALAGGAAPRSALERRLRDLVAEVLGLTSVGIHDDFFELGGDSMLAIGLARRARERGLAVTPRDVFVRRDVAELAAGLGATHDEEGSDGQPVR